MRGAQDGLNWVEFKIGLISPSKQMKMIFFGGWKWKWEVLCQASERNQKEHKLYITYCTNKGDMPFLGKKS